MNISFPINIILRKGLTADDYTICTLLSEKKYGLLNLYKDLEGDYVNERIVKLLHAGYLQFNGFGSKMPMKEISITDKFRALVSADNPFEELYNKYPKKITRPNGKEDYLRTDKVKCQVKYKKLIDKNKLLHTHIMECLDKEIKDKEKTQSMGYFKQLRNWLDGQEWKKYEDDYKTKKQSDKESSIKTYGTELL